MRRRCNTCDSPLGEVYRADTSINSTAEPFVKPPVSICPLCDFVSDHVGPPVNPSRLRDARSDR